MKTKNLLLLIISLVLLWSCSRKTGVKQTGDSAGIEKRVEDILSKMTLDEKIGQLNQYTSRWEMTGPAPANSDSMFIYNMLRNGQLGSMLNVTGTIAARKVQQWAIDSSRLHIPLILGYDVIHGYRTIFPIPLAEAASWEPGMAEISARVAATEASAAGIHWTFAPMVDIARDARWGRIMEGSGEDTYLGARFAFARVKGFQGDDLSAENTIAACAKHFAGYGFSEAGRDYNTVLVDENTLQNVIFPPFKACIDAGVATFMNSFNVVNGIPATASSYLQRDVLKGGWNFDGFVVSDWGSIGEIINHGVAADKKEAAKLAINAGSDMDMESNCYIGELKGLVESGEVEKGLIDEAVRRILRIKFRLGLFDDPYKYCNPEREKQLLLCADHLEKSREVARRSIVLLKNEGNLLPLKKSISKIAVIGELASSKDVPLGSWRAQGIPNSAVSLLEGIQNIAPGAKVIFEKGPVYVKNERSFANELDINTTDKKGIAEAKRAAASADVVIAAIGEDSYQSGEGRSQANISLKGLQLEWLQEICKLNKHVVVVLMNGRPLELNWVAENVPAVVEAWFLGSEAGNAIADVLFGEYNPSGKLPVSFPRSVGQLPLYYNRLSTGRGKELPGLVFWSHYADERNDALFPFGYGLSYTTFDYSNLKLSSESLTNNTGLTVSADIMNSGAVAGEEVVQLYIRDLVGSVSRPVKELKGFEKIMLKPGEKKTVTFTLSGKDLEFFTANHEWATEPGEYIVWIGTDSVTGLEGKFTLK